MVEVGGVFYVGFLAISFFEDLSQAFSLGTVDELVGYDVGECGSEGYAQDDEGGFDAVCMANMNSSVVSVWIRMTAKRKR